MPQFLRALESHVAFRLRTDHPGLMPGITEPPSELSLEEVATEENLRRAFEAVVSQGPSCLLPPNPASVEEARRNLDGFLGDLQQALLEGSYKASPHDLGIGNLRDHIVDRAIALTASRFEETFNDQPSLFRDLRDKIQGTTLSTLTQYRVWLGILWLLRRLNDPVYADWRQRGPKHGIGFIQSRRALIGDAGASDLATKAPVARIGSQLGQLRKIMGLPPAPPTPPASPAIPSGSTTAEEREQACEKVRIWYREHWEWFEGQNVELPVHMDAWSESLRELARAILAVPQAIVDAAAQRAATKWLLEGMARDWEHVLAQEFKPERPDYVNPIVLTATWAFDRVLREDLPTQRARRGFILLILDTIYPKGYVNQPAVGMHRPSRIRPAEGTWGESIIRDYQNRDPH